MAQHLISFTNLSHFGGIFKNELAYQLVSGRHLSFNDNYLNGKSKVDSWFSSADERNAKGEEVTVTQENSGRHVCLVAF